MKFSDLDLLSIGNTIQLAGAVFVGEEKMLLCLFPEDRGDIYSGEHKVWFSPDSDSEFAVEVLDMDRADWEVFIRQTDILETEVLQNSSDGKLAKVILRKSTRQIDTAVSWSVFKRDGYACRYCGKDDVPLTVDHLVLWEEGGPSTAENLVSACKKCNRKRGNMHFREWLQDRYYLKVSKNLAPEVRGANLNLIPTLKDIPRMIHKRSR